MRVVNAASARGASLAQLEDYLENLPATDTSAVLTEKLAEDFATSGQTPNPPSKFYQRAFKLNPSPQQENPGIYPGARRCVDSSQNRPAGAIVYY